MVKFNKNSIIKAKNYQINYIVKDEKYCPIIVITNNRYIFSLNSNI